MLQKQGPGGAGELVRLALVEGNEMANRVVKKSELYFTPIHQVYLCGLDDMRLGIFDATTTIILEQNSFDICNIQARLRIVVQTSSY